MLKVLLGYFCICLYVFFKYDFVGRAPPHVDPLQLQELNSGARQSAPFCSDSHLLTVVSDRQTKQLCIVVIFPLRAPAVTLNTESLACQS